MIHTRLCDLFGVEHPILNAPMGGGDAPGRLAAAVSEAGALGMIGGTTFGGERWLLDEIRVARDHTDRPFGAGFICHLPNAFELMRVALRERVPVIALSFADPAPFVAPAHDAGAVVICQVRSVDQAKRAAEAGVDAITAQGTEAGGHTGRMSTLPLVPAVVDAVSPVPVLAAGGIADGRGVAAALVLGADGVWIGTRFLATDECGVPDDYKARVLAAGGGETILTEVFDIARGIPWPDGVAGRALHTGFVDEWHGREDALRDRVSDSGPVASVADYSAATWAGEASGFVTAREPAGDVVRTLVAQAADVLARRGPEVVEP
ncbi:MAG TPA: nitronate monooxygenase [Acidimicrobiia bacterium]